LSCDLNAAVPEQLGGVGGHSAVAYLNSGVTPRLE
jgi:hypothetical protein